MVDIVFPPSILKRYKEFIIESAVVTPVPSFGAIAATGSDVTLLGTVPIGALQATTYPVVAHYLRTNLAPGGLSGDGILGILIGVIRDSTKAPSPLSNGLKSAVAPFATGVNGQIDSSQTTGLFSGVAAANQDFLNPFTFITGAVLGNSLAYDLFLLRQGNAVSPKDPGTWKVNNFSGTYAILLFGAIPVKAS